jgi:hypothetical protein
MLIELNHVESAESTVALRASGSTISKNLQEHRSSMLRPSLDLLAGV